MNIINDSGENSAMINSIIPPTINTFDPKLFVNRQFSVLNMVQGNRIPIIGLVLTYFNTTPKIMSMIPNNKLSIGCLERLTLLFNAVDIITKFSHIERIGMIVKTV